MPWYGTVLISFFSAALGAAFAWIGIYIQLRHDREKDKRQWSRQVRSEPLLAFRKQVAKIAEICRRSLDIMVASTFADTRVEGSIPKTLPEQDRKRVKESTLSGLKFDEHLQNAFEDLMQLWESGEFQRAMYELDDKVIIDQAKQLQNSTVSSMRSIIDIMAQKSVSKREQKDQTIAGTSLNDPVAQVKERLEKIDDTIVEIQRLINKRLQEL